MPPSGDHPNTSGGRPTLPSTTAGRQLGQLLRDRLANDPAWHTFTTDQRRWVCPWCLSGIQRRPQRSWEDSIGAHLEGCRHYGGGKFSPQPTTSVQAQLSFENMVCRAETDQAWQVFDSQGLWICPACLDKIPDARLVANQRNTLTFRGMALHLQRCTAYGMGTLNAAPVVRAAKDRVGGSGNTRATSALALPARTPSGGAPAQTGRTPSGPIIPARPPTADLMPRVATPISGAPVAMPLGPPKQSPPATTGNQLRPRRFLTPAPGQLKVDAPGGTPAEASPSLFDTVGDDAVVPQAPGFNWMDAADAAAGAVAQDEPVADRSDMLRARDLQLKLLGEVPDIPGFVFATRYEPCDDVSGDFFCFIRLLDGRIGFAIGDVSGHGMQAGLVMSMAKKCLEIYGELIGDPAEVLAKVNDALAGDLGGKMFVSMTYAILCPAERTIRWARAGHPPAMVRSGADGKINEIKPPGMVVGMKGGQVFRDSLQVETTHLDPGDIFLLYTDGVTEMANAQGEEFETDRLREIMERCTADGPDALLTQVMDRIRHFRGTMPLADDVTMLALAVV